MFVAVLLTASSLAAAQWIRSPQQRMAETAPPEQTLLTADVEQRVLKETLVVRGQVRAAGTLEVTPASSGGGRAVVTAVRVPPGKEFGAGDVLLEVAGRPLVALPGKIPAYRDLRPGTEGRDVAQLQQALASLGYPSSDRSGVFGSGTKTALSRFFDRIGYDVATTGEDDAKAVVEATSAVRMAERARSEAKEDLAVLRTASNTPSAIRDAERQVRYAEEDLSRSRRTLSDLIFRSGPMLPMDEAVYLPSFPARVEKLSGAVGQEVKPPLLTLSSGDLVVRSKLNPAQRTVLKVGMRVTVNSELGGESYVGEVISIGDLLQDEAGARSHELVVRTTKKLPGKLAGADVRLTIEAASTRDEVLVVPVSALYTGVDGQTAVRRLLPDGSTGQVLVQVGVTGDGYTAVEPVKGELTAGDRVVVGKGPL
ncbi:peptidoglycan-binding protein [Micromonospora chersina]|uniref:peptidoglycan-binding protein n=1 Tax=Micromonospora chersina TaxID=47854 RepID=UPI0033AA5267